MVRAGRWPRWLINPGAGLIRVVYSVQVKCFIPRPFYG